MNGLTICQPYAHLIAVGSKWVENRSWFTRYRGLLAIHAGRSRSYLLPGDLIRFPDLEFGAIVAVCQLADCYILNHIRRMARYGFKWRRLATHVHTEGPFCWVLEDTTRLDEPIPFTGRQGLWRVPGKIAAKLHKAWKPTR